MLSKLLNNYDVRKYEIVNSKVQDNLINNFPIYVINLREDKTRRNYIKMLFKKHKINYSLIVVERFRNTSGIDMKIGNSILGCILSHLWCINNAIHKNYKRFIIFEDDIIFHKNFDNLFKQIMNSYIENIDLLMLGALDTNLQTNLQKFNNKQLVYYPTSNILGAHANIYKLEFAKEFLNYKLNSPKIIEFDYDYMEFINKFKIGICIPNLVICELSTTNISHHFSPLSNAAYERYKKWFPENFTYDDYEYIMIIFINFIKEKINNGVSFNDFEEMVTSFKRNYKNRNIEYISKSLLNSNYKKEDILEIFMYMKVDYLCN